MNVSRQPAGVPSGGQFATQPHSETDVSLAPVDLSKVDVICHACGSTVAGVDYLEHDQTCNDDDDVDGNNDDMPVEEMFSGPGSAGEPFVYPGRIGQTFEEQVALESELAEANGTDPFASKSQVSWSRLGDEFGSRHATDLFDTFHGDLETATKVGTAEWAKVVPDVETRYRVVTVGVAPSDFSSEDRDRRMWACSQRGDIVFEGHLTSDAFDLSRHGLSQQSQVRVLGSPATVVMAGVEESWSNLSTGEQLSYIDGYAAAAEGVLEARRRQPEGPLGLVKDRGLGVHGEDSARGWAAHGAGFRRAVEAAGIFERIKSGDTDGVVFEVAYGDAAGKVALVERPVPVPARGFDDFTGSVIPGQYRWGASGETLPWYEGAPVRFGVDQVLGMRPKAHDS